MSKLQVTNVPTKLNSFTIWMAFAGKVQASILLNIYVFTSQFENPNSYVLKINENSENLQIPLIKQITSFDQYNSEKLNMSNYIVKTITTYGKEIVPLTH